MNVKLQKEFGKLEPLIEHKILEFLGDPDEGLKLRKDFLNGLDRRLKNKSKGVSQKSILKKYGIV